MAACDNFVQPLQRYFELNLLKIVFSALNFTFLMEQSKVVFFVQISVLLFLNFELLIFLSVQRAL